MNTTLRSLLEKQDKSILFAGVGNVLKHDDGVGVYIALGIMRKNGVRGLPVEMCIENYIGRINSLGPDLLVIIDACDFGSAPGFYRLARCEELSDMTSNTHNISLSKLSELFIMPVYILGIQPADISFGEGICRVVTETADRIIQGINSKRMVPASSGSLAEHKIL